MQRRAYLHSIPAVVLALLLILAACKKSPIEHDKLLQGTYLLETRYGGCDSKNVVSDQLVLHAGGELEQHSILKAGPYDSARQHWKYIPEDSVSLNDWFDFTDNPTGKPERAVLLVDFEQPTTILVNPDSPCVYVKQ
jgi:hypothetical protein